MISRSCKSGKITNPDVKRRGDLFDTGSEALCRRLYDISFYEKIAESYRTVGRCPPGCSRLSLPAKLYQAEYEPGAAGTDAAADGSQSRLAPVNRFGVYCFLIHSHQPVFRKEGIIQQIHFAVGRTFRCDVRIVGTSQQPLVGERFQIQSVYLAVR